MYIISKLYWILLQPLSLAFGLVILGLLFGLLGWHKLQGAAGVLAALVLFVTLFTSTGALLLQVLEARFERPVLAAPPTCVVVLGGGFESEITTARHSYEMNESGDRFVEMMRLARLYPEAAIIVSGGDGHMTAQFEDDGTIARRMLEDFGLGSARLLVEATSRNTFENALNSRAILQREGLSNCLLVTSAFHMPRAVGMFRSLGVPVVPWPVDYQTDGRTPFAVDITQAIVNTDLLTRAMREWSGLIGNYLAGRTDSLFPAP